MKALPRGLGERGVGAHYIANHLPGGEVERALGRRAHGQRNRALRTETDALRRRFLPRPDSYRLGEEVDGDGFLPGLKLAAAAKAIQAVQDFRPRRAQYLLMLLSRRRRRRHKYVEGFPEGVAIDLGRTGFARADSA